MIHVFKISIARPFVVLACVEFFLFMVCFYIGVIVSWVDFVVGITLIKNFLPQAAVFASVFTISMFAMGLYEGLLNSSVASILARFAVAFGAGFVVLAAIFYAIPEFSTWRAVTGGAVVLAFVTIAIVHVIFLKFVDSTPLKRRILVIGTGLFAERIQDLERREQAYGYNCLGFVEVSDDVPAVVSSKVISHLIH